MSWSGYIPGSLLDRPLSDAEKLTQSLEALYWQRPDYSIKTHGPGGKPSIEAYPFQGMHREVHPYSLDEHGLEATRSLDAKFAGQVTPWGTPLAELIRTGGELLTAPCGDCQRSMSKCRCAFQAATA